MPSKTCEKCQIKPRIKDERYCKECKKVVLAELKEVGYLTPKPFSAFRPSDAQELTRETKFGQDR